MKKELLPAWLSPLLQSYLLSINQFSHMMYTLDSTDSHQFLFSCGKVSCRQCFYLAAQRGLIYPIHPVHIIDITSHFFTDNCQNVSTETILQTLTGENFSLEECNHARLDIYYSAEFLGPLYLVWCIYVSSTPWYLQYQIQYIQQRATSETSQRRSGNMKVELLKF